MIECPECSAPCPPKNTPWGVKVQCPECGHLVRDVDKYAGVMVWSHKTAPELEIHANAESASLVTGASRKSVPYGKPRVVQHVGEMATRRGTTARAGSETPRRTYSGVKASTGPLTPARDPVREYLKSIRVPVLRLLPQRVPGSKSVTQIWTRHLCDVEDLLLMRPPSRIALLEEIERQLGYNRNQSWWLLACRRVVTPPRSSARGRTVRILSLEGKHYTADRVR